MARSRRQTASQFPFGEKARLPPSIGQPFSFHVPVPSFSAGEKARPSQNRIFTLSTCLPIPGFTNRLKSMTISGLQHFGLAMVSEGVEEVLEVALERGTVALRALRALRALSKVLTAA